MGKKKDCTLSMKDFDEALIIPHIVFRCSGIRFMQKDSEVASFIWNLIYWLEFIVLFTATIQEILYMIGVGQKGGAGLEVVGEIFRMMPCVGYLILSMSKSYKLIHCYPLHRKLLSELRDMFPIGKLTEEEYKIVSTGLKKVKTIINGYYWCNNVLLTIFLLPCYVDCVRRALGHDVPRYLPFYFWFPFDPLQKYYYEPLLVLQTWQAALTVWFILAGDMMYCLYLTHITIQFDLLSIRINQLIYVPTDRQMVAEYPLARYSKEYLKNVRETTANFTPGQWKERHQRELEAILTTHRTLIRFSDVVEDMFSFTLLLNFINSSVIICFCGFCCIIVEKWHELIYKLFLVTSIVQTWLLCWYGQRLLESSRGVSEALYNSGWYKVDMSVSKAILIMIHRAQKEVRVTAYGFSVVSLASFTTIIKTAWSYFTLLLNLVQEV